MEFLFQGLSQESLWLLVVFYDLLLVVILYKFFGKYGLYTAVILGIILGNLQGGKVSEFVIFDTTFTVSMGAILYSGIYFSTDLLNEKYGKTEANRAVNLGFFANVAVLLTLLLSLLFKPSDLTGSALEVHNALSVIASYSPAFIIGSLTAYFISQKFDVWFFNYLKTLTQGKYLWLRNNLSTIISQLIDTFIYTFTWVIATDLSIYEAFNIADKVAIINDGKIQQIGNPYDIYHKPNNKFVADFIGLGVFMPIKKLSNEDFEIPLGILDDNKIKNDLSKNFKSSYAFAIAKYKSIFWLSVRFFCFKSSNISFK